MEELLFPEDWGADEAAPQDEEEAVQEEEVQGEDFPGEEEEEVVEEEEEVVDEEEEVVEEEEEVVEEEEAQEEEAMQEEEIQEEVEETQENVEAAPDADDDDDADMDDDLAAMEAAANAQWGAEPSEPVKKPERPVPPWKQAGPHSASKGSEKGVSSGFSKGKAKGKEKGAAKGMGKGDGMAKGLAKGKEKGAAKGMAIKRPLSPAASGEGAPLAKRPVAQSPGMGGAAAQTSAAGQAAGAVKVKLKRVVAEKLEMLKSKGIKLGASAVQALALAEPRDAQILIAALAKKSGEIANPTRWVEVSLERRANTAPAAATDGQQSAKAPAVKAVVAKSPVAKAPVAKAPVAKAPVAKSPVAKAPAPQQASEEPKAPAASNLPAGVKVIKLPGRTASASPQQAKAPIAKAPVAKAPIAKAPVSKAPGAKAGGLASPSGVGTPPRLRTEQELEFFEMAVQAKLLALNKQGVWKGPHPLDEAALVALLSIDSARAMEILDEAEEQGKQLASPSRFVRDQVAEEQKL